MRCACTNCGEYMIHAETAAACVCPTCGARCNACLGTKSAPSPEEVRAMKEQALAGRSRRRSV